ncbi:phage tail tube protein [Parvibaculum sp.]|uniref:phage tail tube protein n=1 Tax=Parvibaculum sp. TaxID=2024848 RepID=UPI00391A1168
MARNTYGWDLTAAFGPEQTFGTAAVADTYTEVPFYTHGLGRNKPLEDDPVLGERLVRAPHAKVEGLADHGGQWVCPFDLGNIGLYLRGLLGVPATSGDGDYTHVFKPGSGELISNTLQIRQASNRFLQHRGLVVNGLSSSLAREGGYRRLTVDFKGADETVLGASAAGEVGEALTVDRLPAFRGVIKKGGAEMASIVSANWSFTNNVTPYDGPGSAAVAGYDPGIPAFTASLTARQTAAGHALYDLANDGTRFALALEWVLSATKSLTFAIGNAVLAPSSAPVNGPDGQQYTFDVSAEPDDEEADKAFFVATLKNQIASYALPEWA